MIDLAGPLQPGHCRGCEQAILWARTAKGRSMILNPDPDPAGNCVVDGQVYMPHWQSCPHADMFRTPADAGKAPEREAGGPGVRPGSEPGSDNPGNQENAPAASEGPS